MSVEPPGRDAAGTADAATPRSPFAPATLLAVLVGGALGTAARIGLGALFVLAFGPRETFGWVAYTPLTDATFEPSIDVAAPLVGSPALGAALVANLAGSLALGLVAGAHWPARLEWLRAALGTGFCGAFTTFSLVTLAFTARGFADGWSWALLLVGLLGGLLFAAVGMQIGRAVSPAPGRAAAGAAGLPDGSADDRSGNGAAGAAGSDDSERGVDGRPGTGGADS